MKCPHCLVSFHESPAISPQADDSEADWTLYRHLCPTCHRFIFELCFKKIRKTKSDGSKLFGDPEVILVWPKSPSRAPLSKEVPPEFADDYKEACLVLHDSPKASAALSRRCLQHILHEMAGVKAGSLAKEIQIVIDSGKLPSHLAGVLDAVRNIGNFAAHTSKDLTTGEIVEVESGEAEWNLNVLESLFDFYFIQPELTKRRKAELNQKLTAAGKPPIP